MPGNHDIGDNPTEFGPPTEQPVTEESRQYFVSVIGEDRWSFDAAGWRFIGLNSMVMHSGLACEAEQFDWLTSQLSATGSKPVALFLHKPLYLNTPDDPELAATSSRYVPQPARRRVIELLDAVDLRLVASGHIHQRRETRMLAPAHGERWRRSISEPQAERRVASPGRLLWLIAT